MKKIVQFSLSDTSLSTIKDAVEKLGICVRQEMNISEINHLKISLDLDRNTTGKFMGVKITGYKMQEVEVIYDTDLDPEF